MDPSAPPPPGCVRRRWIGGSPCAGKSTIAAALAGRFGLRSYNCDDAFDRHAARAGRSDGPTLAKVTSMPVGDRLAQPIQTQVADVLRAYREEFPLLLADLAAADAQTGSGWLIEGAALLPELLAAAGVRVDEAIWFVPTEAFQRRHYARRGWAHRLLADLPEPAVVFDRWMRRDAAFARAVIGQAQERGYRVVIVDGAKSTAQLATIAADHLNLGAG
jgi:2-phosphoglycerate kinase